MNGGFNWGTYAKIFGMKRTAQLYLHFFLAHFLGLNNHAQRIWIWHWARSHFDRFRKRPSDTPKGDGR